MRSSSRAIGLVLGFAADWYFADPRRGHPVAGFGQVASGLRRVLYADSRVAGAAYAGVLVSGAAAIGVVAERAGRNPVLGTALTAAATWTVLGGTSLRREASRIGESLSAGDLAAARERLPHLCGRDPSGLDADQIARAVVESVAENTSDAVVAPLFWGAVAGIPGLLAYRASNTLDAMVGYRNAKYQHFGWASARLDDVLNWVPARFTGAVTVAAAPVVGGDPVRALRVLRRDGGSHPSPNAGRCEASAAPTPMGTWSSTGRSWARGGRLGSRTSVAPLCSPPRSASPRRSPPHVWPPSLRHAAVRAAEPRAARPSVPAPVWHTVPQDVSPGSPCESGAVPQL
jgi:adenosylcobinamide-phosphate synthase